MRPLIIMAGIFIMLATTAGYGQGASPLTGAKFGSYAYLDYFYNIGRDPVFLNGGSLSNAVSSGEKDYQGFQARRIYFTYDNVISERFSGRFRLEMDASGARDIKVVPFVKDAYLKWHGLFEGSDLYFGIQPTTAFEISENAWGYRSLEKTIMDLRGIVPSRDFGAALRGKVDESGTVNYWVMFSNGNGNKNLPKDKQKRYAATVHLRPAEGFQLTVLGDYRTQAEIADPNDPAGTLGNNVFTAGAFAGYADPERFSVGVEGFLQSTANGFTPSSAANPGSLKKTGLSAWASVNVQPDLALVGRFDYFDPNTDGDVAAKGDARNLFIGALAWKPEKNVSIMPNIVVETYESLPAPAPASYDASVTGRLTVYYVFL